MPPLDPALWEEVRRRVRDGEKITDLAKAYDLHPSSIHRRLATARTAKAKPAKRPGGVRRGVATRRASAKPVPKQPVIEKVKPSTRPASALKVRRQLIGRLYRAIDTKLKLMERRMNSEIHALDAQSGNSANPVDESAMLTAADHERETRAFGALVKTINSVRQMQAELEHLANANTTAAPSTADARLAADADRYRRDIAERLAKFVPPQP